MMQNPFDRFDTPAPTRRQGQIFTSPYREEEEQRKRQDQVREDRRLGISQTMADIAASNAARDAQSDANKPVQQKFDNRAKLYDDFRMLPSVKSYSNAISAYGNALQSPSTPEGDLSLVYSYAKIMDPDSVVREGEAQSVVNSSPYAQQIAAQLQKQFGTGGMFTDEARQRLREALKVRMSNLNRGYIADRVRFKDLAEQAGIDPISVIGSHVGEPYRDIEATFLGREPSQADYRGNLIEPERKTIAQGATPWADPAPKGLEVNVTDDRRPGETDAQYEARSRVDQSTGSQPTFLRGVGQGLNHVWDRAAVGLESGINGVFGTNLSAAREQADQNQQYFRQNPGSEGGQLLGNIAGSAIPALRMGAFAGGAAGGLLGGDSNTAGGLARDALAGGIGGKVADAGLRTLAGTVAPRLNPSVARLGQEGVPMSIPTMLGGRWKAVEDAATSLPVAGPQIRAGREAANAGVNVAAYRRALNAAGIRAPKDLPAGHEGVAFVEQALGDKYNSVLQNMQVGLDRTFQTRMSAVMKRARLRPQEQQELQSIFEHEIGGAFSRGPVISGREYKTLDERLGQIATAYKGRADDAYAQQLGRVIGDVQEQMRAVARRQNPRIAPELRRADAGWAVFSRIRAAAAKSGNDGIASPAQLMAAVRQGDRTVGRGATARGDALLQDLASDAQNVLPRGIGDSGTADREALTSTRAWLAGLAMKPLYNPALTKAGANLLLTPRHPAAEAVANSLRRLPGGAIGGVYSGMLLAPPNR